MRDISKACRSILEKSLAVTKEDHVLIVTDDNKLEIGQALYREACDLAGKAMLLIMQPADVNGQEPPDAVAEAMKKATVVICPTTRSLTHTNAKINACKEGTRIATMPNISADMFLEGAITADYTKVEELTLRMTALLDKADTAVIEKEGTRLTLNLKGRKGVPSTGVYRKPGQSGNLPSGEAYIAPLEDGADGEMIIDGSMVGLGKLSSPLKVTLKGGKLIKIEGEGSEKLGVLTANERNATIAELGIGTNEAAILCGIILEDEKLLGTVHIAFGTNTSFGGVNKADIHMDGIILEPDLWLDDVKVIEKGQFLV